MQRRRREIRADLGQPLLEQLGHRDAHLAVLADSGLEEQLRFEVAGDAWRHQVRRIALDDVTVRLLRERRAAQAEIALACGVGLDADAYALSDDPAGRAPLHPNLLSDRFRRLVRVLDIRCRLHDLRHWHVTQALGAGLPVRDVAERVGHASARMTLDVYGHAIADSDRKAAEIVAGLLTPSVAGRPVRPS